MGYFNSKESDRKTSYAQSGEDLIVDFVLSVGLHIPKPTYLDLGAYHPVQMSNTYLLYTRGSRGVCVEPDPSLCAEFRRRRRQDICLNGGVAARSSDGMDFYTMSVKSLNTFSRDEAERYQNYGTCRIESVTSVPVWTANDIIQRYFSDPPNFISIDVEGLDLEVLSGLDLGRLGAEVFCVETLTYTEDNTAKKKTEIIDFMITQDYFVYGDTYINTIFVKNQAWKNRQ